MESLTELISHISFIDVVDVTLVSFIIYKFFNLIQGTKATQMVFGLAALGVLYWVSFTLELNLLNWLFQHFFKSFFLILVIVFQDQIRSALSAIGNSKIKFKNMKKNSWINIEEIVKATQILNKKRMGGLIVIERDYGLFNFSQTGVFIDSHIKAELIVSLFHPSSPMHDGAMIIYEGKIQAVGCVLPLSTTVTNRRNFGTRHLAALGLSEISDAIIIVVSEETGNITAFENNESFYLGTEQEVYQYLNSKLNLKNKFNKETIKAA